MGVVMIVVITVVVIAAACALMAKGGLMTEESCGSGDTTKGCAIAALGVLLLIVVLGLMCFASMGTG